MSKGKVLVDREGNKFLIKDASKDYHTKFGFFGKEDMKKAGKIKSSTGKAFSIFDASFIDLYRRIKRNAQIIPLKDVGLIIAETGINKSSKIFGEKIKPIVE